ncbi:MAG: hypothetical protein R2941_04600 [Desulfobacterales bacterium]
MVVILAGLITYLLAGNILLQGIMNRSALKGSGSLNTNSKMNYEEVKASLKNNFSKNKESLIGYMQKPNRKLLGFFDNIAGSLPDFPDIE